MAALAIVLYGASLSAQTDAGTITGRVTDAGSGAALTSANVRVTGTQIGAQTDAAGTYTIRGIAPGTHDLQVNRIGYEARHVGVTVAAGQTVTSNVTLTQAAFSLATVVTTVTGATSKAELPNTVATVNVAAKVDETSAHSLGEMLSGQAAGVQISSAGAAGGGSRIRIRGQHSLSLSNAPVVYIDGIRVNSQDSEGNSTGPSRFDDINPEEIESIDVLKGPAAATLYGTEAANGVIIITTKKGKAGANRFSVFTEEGISHDPAAGHYRDLWEGYDNTTTPGKHAQCYLVQEAQGSCQIDSLYHRDVLNVPGLTPIVNGNSKDVGLQASGGSNNTQYFVSGEYNSIMGTYKMPQFEVDRLTAERGAAPLDNQINPNADRRINLRSNLSTQLGSTADFTVSVGYLNRADRQPPNEDNGQGLMVAAMAGSAANDNVDSRGIPLYGYLYPLGDVFSINNNNYINRYTTSLNARYYPVSWLNMRANFGYDYTGSHNNSGNYLDQGPCCGSARDGSITDTRGEDNFYTVDLGATATNPLWRSFDSKFSVGTQVYDEFSQTSGSTGSILPPGSTIPDAGATQSAHTSTAESVQLGSYAEEVVSWADQIYVTGGLRYDGNSAFGKNFKGVFYPKIGASWLLSQAGWFPRTDKLNSLRLRATYGTSGVEPGGNDAARYYTTTTGDVLGQNLPGVYLGSVGNLDLKPEFSSEWEGGFDATVFNGRTTLELTYYNQHTSDAIISRPLAPSVSGLPDVRSNIGSVRNLGFEYTLNNRIIDNNRVGFDLQLTGSTTHNKIITLGQGVTPISTGNRATQYNAPGYPLFGYWGKTYTYNDADKNGIITPDELAFSDTAVFIGSSYPTIEFAANPRLELLHRKLAITAQFDHKEGLIKFDNTLRNMCDPGGSCRGLSDINAGLAAQAAAQVTNAFSYYTGQYENGKFTRLREVSASYQLPDKLAARIHSSRALLVVAGRNLHVWTPYTGVDPEATVGNGDQRGNEEYFSTPPLRFFTVRLNLTF